MDVEKEKELRTHFSREEIQHKVNLYNAATRDHLKMTLHPSGLYTGFIKVQLELRRPITMRAGAGAGGRRDPGDSSNTVRQVIEALLNKFTVADNPAKFALYKRCRTDEQADNPAKFALYKRCRTDEQADNPAKFALYKRCRTDEQADNPAKFALYKRCRTDEQADNPAKFALYKRCRTDEQADNPAKFALYKRCRTDEQADNPAKFALYKRCRTDEQADNPAKFALYKRCRTDEQADNPAKFALYKRCRTDEQEYMCKLSEEEQPLFLRLLSGPNTDTLSFVLRERQTGEVMWDAFSIPELQNFLRILEKEEQEHLAAITERYQAYRHRLQQALTEID
ncbi:hypothetical protein ACEWY4_002262 [Coilia grayii]|uniref:Uncharacterized protein n=1 Tax=Coilia grayii TaxID=363190 RepID=A0ABD1KVA7_9TELE